MAGAAAMQLAWIAIAAAAVAVDPASLPDPTRPAVQAPVARADAPVPVFQVSAIRLGPGSASAVVNGAPVRIGDPVDGAVVRGIDAGGVTIELDGRARRYPLFQTAVKRPVRG